MMDNKTFLQIADEAHTSIREYHLHDALILVEALLKEIDYEAGIRELKSIVCDYDAMMHFLVQGGEDAEKFKQQDLLLRRTFLLTDGACKCRKMNTKGHYLYDQAQYDSIFSKALRYGMTEEVCEFLNRNKQDVGARQQLMGALILNCWEHFNPQVMGCLIQEARHDAYALVGIVAITTRYQEDIKQLWPAIDESLRHLLAMEEVARDVTLIHRELFVSSRSEHLQQTIANDIMPILMEGIKDERIRLGFDQDEEEDDFKKLMNQTLFPSSDEKKLEKKKRQFYHSAMQLLDMQREGMDVNTSLFASSARLPFFQDMANWFKPFDVHDEVVAPLAYNQQKPNSLIMLLNENPEVCDLDKYAIVMQIQRTFSKNNIKDVLGEVFAEVNDAELFKGKVYTERVLSREEQFRNCVRILYRLFTLSRWKSQFTNLFSNPLNPLENSFVAPIYTAFPKHLLTLAELMIKYDERDVTLQLLQCYGEMEGSTAEVLQMQAVCLVSQKKYTQAIFALEQANMLSPDNLSILKLQLITYDLLGNESKKLEVLLKLEELLPDNTKITTDTGLCLMKLGRFQDASQRFYKMEYAGKRIIPSMRAIAWCSMKQQKYETALRYYQKIFQSVGASTWEDYLNAGHVAWITGDMTYALSLYQEYIKRYLTDDPKITDSLAPFDDDCDLLREAGKSARDISLMRELLLYVQKAN